MSATPMEVCVEGGGGADMGLNLQRSADYEVHESYEVDTMDHNDHAFAGIMFDVEVKVNIPVTVVIHSVSVRGTLGHLTVWYCKGGHEGKELLKDQWTKVFEGNKEPSEFNYSRIDLTTPIRVEHGEKIGLYVHSSEENDSSIVYDDMRQEVSHRDKFITVKSGCAHISNRPFSRQAMGWDHWPWRPHREFVGHIGYGVRYKLWRPLKEVANSFPANFRKGVFTLLMCSYRSDSILSTLPPGVVFYMINMCGWDWFGGLLQDEEEEGVLTRMQRKAVYEDAKVYSWRGCDYRMRIYEHRHKVLVSNRASKMVATITSGLPKCKTLFVFRLIGYLFSSLLVRE